MSCVLVVDEERRPQPPVHPGYARWLLSHGKAAVLHRAPFTLILKRVCPEEVPPHLRLKLDPGSKTTGLAVVEDGSGQVVWAAELTHRGSRSSTRWASGAGCARVGDSGTRGIGRRASATAGGSQAGSPRRASRGCRTC